MAYNKIILSFSMILVFLVILQSAKAIEKNDQAFNEYLVKVTQNFTQWLKDNNLDPSPPVEEAITIESYDFEWTYIKCELRNQQISGHSSTQNQSYIADTSFESTYFSIEREQYQPNEFQGNFSCTGRAQTSGPDFYFSGQGYYHIIANWADEVAGYTNVGITNDHKLNLTLAYPEYVYIPYAMSGELEAKWNDSLITDKQLNDIRAEFIRIYQRYLVHSDVQHPVLPMLTNFLLNATKGFDLKTIMPEEDLPLPFIPIPSPPTTPTTPTTPDTTLTEESKQTTPEPTSTEGNKANVLAIPALFAVIIFTAVLNLI